jgi:NADP-reducing hydrogenase subunit HndB
MPKISSLEDLQKMRNELRQSRQSLADPKHPSSLIQVRVTMATCGIASGSKPVMEYLSEELEKRNIPAKVTQTGCMGFCYAEPTVEVTLPGKDPVIFGYVNTRKADEIIERFIRKGESIEGIIPITYETVGE